MDKQNYREITVISGSTLETVVSTLQRYHRWGDKVYVKFKGYYFYSDTVTLDNAYKTITGQTKEAFDKTREERRALYRTDDT